MMVHFIAALLTCLLLGAAALPAGGAQGGPPDNPCRVRTIYVAGLGDSPEAERFRRELKRQLTRRGFVVAEREGEAEAVLTGKLTFGGSDRSGKLVFDQGELRDAAGARLWQGNFHLTRVSRRSLRKSGNVKDAAGKIAANIGGACM